MSQALLIGSKRSRLFLSAVPAAVLTFGVFVGMKLMLDEEVMVAAQTEPRRVAKIEVMREDPTEPRVRQPVKKIEPAAPPPPPAKYAADRSDIKFEPIVLKGSEPAPLSQRALADYIPNPIAIGDRLAQPVSQPLPVYPRRALERGISGDCEVRFDLTPQGRAYNIVPECTDPVFDDSARRAVAQTNFLPQIKNGQALEQKNMVYPLVYKFES